MPNPMMVGVGLSGASALAQKNAASKAAKAQSATADAQIAEVRRQFDTIRKLVNPWVNAGTGALSQQLALLGLGGQAAGTAPAISVIPGSPAAPMAHASASKFLYSSGVITSRDGRSAVRTTNPSAGVVGAAGLPGPTQYMVNGQSFGSMEEAQAYANANLTASPFDQDAANAAQAAAIANLRDGSQFKALVRSGENAILANAAATGGLRGGNTQGALAQYRPAMLQALIDKQLANLGGLSANGLGAASGIGSAAQSSGGQIASILGDKGAAQAGGYLAGGQAMGNFFGDLSGGLGAWVGSQGGIPKGVGMFGKWGF